MDPRLFCVVFVEEHRVSKSVFSSPYDLLRIDYISRENLAAIRKEYDRMIASGICSDTKEAWDIFIHGWSGNRQFQQAKRVLNAGSPGYSSLAALCWVFGTLALGAALLASLTLPVENIEITNLGWLVTGAIVLIGLGFPFSAQAQKAAARAAETHRDYWGDPDDEDTFLVDESEE